MTESKYQIEAIDAFALYESLKRQSGIEWVGFILEDKKTQVFPHTPEWRNAKWLMYKISRYSMDGHGYYVGYEYFTAQIPLYSKNEFQIPGVAYAISPYIIFPNTMDVFENIPAQEEIEHTREEAINFLDDGEYEEWIELSEEEVNELSNSEILDMAYNYGFAEGDYYPPDDEFAWQELDFVLDSAIKELDDYSTKIINGKCFWILGDLEMDLDKIVKNN